MATNILVYATEFRDAVLQGRPSERMCAAISAPLHDALKILAVPNELMVTDLGECNHIFLRMRDGTVLDPTADQFNWCSAEQLPGVYLGPGAPIHADARLWPGGQEWHKLMAELWRLHPSFRARDIGRAVGDVLRTLPPHLCDLGQLA